MILYYKVQLSSAKWITKDNAEKAFNLFEQVRTGLIMTMRGELVRFQIIEAAPKSLVGIGCHNVYIPSQSAEFDPNDAELTEQWER